VTEGLAQALSHSPLAAAAVLFGAGVVTSVTPCVYPLIPITVGLLGGSARSGAPRRRIALMTLCYVLGVALFYAALGAIAGATGQLFGAIGSNRWVLLAVANVFVVAALAMLDVFPVAAPARLVQWAGRLTGGSYPAAFLLGATSGVVAAPCGAPAFAVVLTWVGTTGSALAGFVYLFVFSLGMTVLLAAVGLFSGTLAALPRAGRWMVWIKKAAGIIMLGVAEYYFIRAGSVW
jgi:thiol:disulfide interchange protein DsbD